ncbi:MAG: glycosyltransferase 87 family protein [Candidatus Helarchaeota archaeon]
MQENSEDPNNEQDKVQNSSSWSHLIEISKKYYVQALIGIGMTIFAIIFNYVVDISSFMDFDIYYNNCQLVLQTGNLNFLYFDFSQLRFPYLPISFLFLFPFALLPYFVSIHLFIWMEIIFYNLAIFILHKIDPRISFFSSFLVVGLLVDIGTANLDCLIFLLVALACYMINRNTEKKAIKSVEYATSTFFFSGSLMKTTTLLLYPYLLIKSDEKLRYFLESIIVLFVTIILPFLFVPGLLFSYVEDLRFMSKTYGTFFIRGPHFTFLVPIGFFYATLLRKYKRLARYEILVILGLSILHLVFLFLQMGYYILVRPNIFGITFL